MTSNWKSSRFLWGSIAFIPWLLLTACAATPEGRDMEFPPERPNFLIILTDDMGYTDLGAFGGSDIPTPNLDKLAYEGLRFSNYHASPSCAPTRAMLMSGTGNHEAGLGTQMPSRAFHNQQGYERFLQPRVAVLPEVLSEAGYFTAMSGKWHIGDADPSGGTLPVDRGFDRSYALLRGADKHYGTLHVEQAGYSENGKRLDHGPGEGYSTTRYTDKLIEFLSDPRASTKPFFAVYAPTAPHWPVQYPPGYEGRFAGKYDAGFDELCLARMSGARAAGVLPDGANVDACPKREKAWDDLSEEERPLYTVVMEIYAAMAAHLDEDIGRLLSEMENRGQLDNTWIIFMNDNGPQGQLIPRQLPNIDMSQFVNDIENAGQPDSWLNIGNGWADAISAPYKGMKGSQYEGGIRVPAFAWHREHAAGGRVDGQYLTVMDIMPTVLDLAEVSPPDREFAGREVLPMRGKSMASLLLGDDAPIHGPRDAIALDSAGRRMMVQGSWKIVQHYDNPWELYHLEDDPGEQRDLAAQESERLAQMLKQFEQFAVDRNYIGIQSPRRRR